MNIRLNQTEKHFDDLLFFIKKFEFEKKRIHGIVGHNGIGKSTLLRMIGGLDFKYQGIIKYNNNVYCKQLSRDITYISQKPYMLQKSVYDNIAYPLKIRGFKSHKIDEEVHKWLSKLNIDHLKHRKAIVLSGGEQQKVALARGLIFAPRLVLLDEPTASIAPNTVDILERAISEYQREYGATVILVTHNLSQAIRLCDSIHVFDHDGISNISKKDMIMRFNQYVCSDELLT